MSFRLAKTQGDSGPELTERDLASGQAFAQGALLVVNGSGQYAECGADPASIAAVAATPCGPVATPAFTMLSKQEFPPGKMQGIPLDDFLTFRAQYVGTLPAANGGSYGVVKDSDGKWKVDFTDTTNTRVKLVGRLTDSPENLPEVLVKFLAANIQLN